MKRIKGHHLHEICPQDWKRVQDITGSHELDVVIARNSNKDMRDRIRDHVTTESEAYGPLTGYSGYRNYHGDS